MPYAADTARDWTARASQATPESSIRHSRRTQIWMADALTNSPDSWAVGQLRAEACYGVGWRRHWPPSLGCCSRSRAERSRTTHVAGKALPCSPIGHASPTFVLVAVTARTVFAV